MGTSVQELKHAARPQEWSGKDAECRSSGISVKSWCAEQGIALKTYYNWEKQIIKAATQQYALPVPARAGLLMQVNPETMPGSDVALTLDQASPLGRASGLTCMSIPVCVGAGRLSCWVAFSTKRFSQR